MQINTTLVYHLLLIKMGKIPKVWPLVKLQERKRARLSLGGAQNGTVPVEENLVTLSQNSNHAYPGTQQFTTLMGTVACTRGFHCGTAYNGETGSSAWQQAPG